ncbi:MAG: LeuD/DmdB family oxidoreductase small subunit [Candidatus Ranarchaeia archaeon]
MKAIIEGKVWVFGDDVDTDQIFPGPYLALTSNEEIAKHAMEGTKEGPVFQKNAKPGDIIIAGTNFGSGSSREQAPLSIKNMGISIVIVESFSRIFYRNAINIGLPILEIQNITKKVQTGDICKIDWPEGILEINETKEKINGKPPKGLEIEILESGGILNYLKKNKK